MKMIVKSRALIVICLYLITTAHSRDVRSRKKRFLIFPKTTPTRHSFIVGFGIPLNLEVEAMTMGLVMKAFYFLPDVNNTFQNFPHFPGILVDRPPTISQPILQEFPNGRKKRDTVIDKLTGQKYEKYIEEVEEVGNEELKNCSYSSSGLNDDFFEDEFPEDEKLIEQQILISADLPADDEIDEELMDTSGTRWLMYDGLGRLLNSKGLEGRVCVLRGICEAAHTKFTHRSGLFGELAHIFFTPSTTHDPIVNSDHHDYVKAEKLGEEGELCDKIFRNCRKSLMDIFTQVYESELYKFD